MSDHTNDFFMVHKPIMPPRKDHIGEQVFSSMWEALMTTGSEEVQSYEDQPIVEVLRHFHSPVEQRHATVLASVVCWLGTAIGGAMLRQAEQQIAGGRGELWSAYLLAWAIKNRRRFSVNHGIRTVEFILAPRELWNNDGSGRFAPGLKELPTLSADDIEVIDHLMLWLGEGEGQSYLRQCREEEKRLNEERALADRAAQLRAAHAHRDPDQQQNTTGT